MSVWLRLLIAVAVATHGFVYVPFGLVVPGTLRGRAGPSLLLGHIAPAPVVRGAVPVGIGRNPGIFRSWVGG